MSINNLVKELKENNQDFELYPTTKEMIKVIYEATDGGNWLDIGCGTCNFRKHYGELAREQQDRYNKKMQLFRNSYVDGKGYNYDLQPKNSEEGHFIRNYYVIEKSEILLNKLDNDTIVLGTDFNATLLIDKPVQNIFCNPPYSEYEQWASRIISEAHAENIFLIIPQRWKDNEEIQRAIKKSNSIATVLGSFDFLHAERQARAKVDIIRVRRKDYYRSDREYNEQAFDEWFNATYEMRENKETNWREEEEKKQEIHNKLMRTDTSKAKMLVDLYNEEMLTYTNHFKAICGLDVDVLETIGVKKNAVKEALKMKATGTKAKYWEYTFNELEEITERLTSGTRSDMLNRFTMLKKVDFTLENIYPMLLWVLKNANTYYNEQLITFFKELTSPENVKPYKSNQKVFERCEWRHNRYADKDKLSHYTLDYRIIMSSPFCANWYSGQLETDSYGMGGAKQTLNDIFVIARNLGFNIGLCDMPKCFGEKCTVLYEKSDKVFMEYRAYKNGNMHIKFDIEFAKALNVEVSRLLGWIKKPEDIKNEFPAELAKGAEKYFKQNYTCLGTGSMPLLTVKKDPQFRYTEDKEQQKILIENPYNECLETILKNIDNFNAIIEEDKTILKNCLNILETQKGFIYRNCLICKQENKTVVEFREPKDYEQFKKLLNGGLVA